MTRNKRRCRNGMTLVELLVALTVIAILLALILPAVQSSRESSRRIQCKSNLANLGRAIQAYESTHGKFPAASPPDLGTPGSPIVRFHAPHVALLSHLDQSTLYHQIDHRTMQPYWRWDAPANAVPDPVLSVAETPLAVFRCPSDPGEFGNNYRFCTGPGIRFLEDPADRGTAGPFMALKEYRARDFLDGLSNTVGVSEKCKSDGGSHWNAETDFWWTGLSSINPTSPTTDELLELCAAQSGVPPSYHPSTGATWYLSTYAYTWYNHAGPPNAEFADCAVDSSARAFSSPGRGVFTARSFHPGGVNCLYMDGSVRYLNDTVDLAVWRAWATRAGGEVM